MKDTIFLIDPIFECIAAPQYYNFGDPLQNVDCSDTWFSTHTEIEGNEFDLEEAQPAITVPFENVGLLNDNTFDAKTPPKMRSSQIFKQREPAEQKPKPKRFSSMIPSTRTPKTTKSTDLPQRAAMQLQTKPTRPSVVVYTKPKLTTPVSPFFQTKIRASRPSKYIPPRPAVTATQKTIAKPQPKRSYYPKLTEPVEFSFQTKKRALLREKLKAVGQKITQKEPAWVPRLTVPQEFHFHTNDRMLTRKLEKPEVKENVIIPPRPKMTLTEPKSPFLHTARRSRISSLKRTREESLSTNSSSDTEICNKSNTTHHEEKPDQVDAFAGTFDRFQNEPPRKRTRTSLTVVQPFHFHTEDRASVRSLSLTNTGTSESSLSNSTPNKTTKHQWDNKLTEPQPFSFATEQRAHVKQLTRTSVTNETKPYEPLKVLETKAQTENRQNAKQAIPTGNKLPTLTNPKPFRLMTSERSLHKQMTQKTSNITKPIKQQVSNNVNRNKTAASTRVPQVRGTKKHPITSSHKPESVLSHGGRDL